MFSLGILRRQRHSLAYAEILLTRASPVIFTVFLALAAAGKYMLVLRSDGGGDLLGADIPKSLILLKGENPYSTQPWAAPYPPFFLVVLGGIIRLTTSNALSGQVPAALISRNIMVAGILADISTAAMIFLTLRARGTSGLQLLVPASIFLLLPSISITPYFFFHSDVFGYTILAGSLLAYEKRRSFLGSLMLGLSAIFKIHPLLAIPLMMVWLVRRDGPRRTVPSIFGASTVTGAGLVAPLFLPGYSGTVFGFNLSTGFGNGTGSFSVMDLFYGVLPSSLHISFDPFALNQLWVLATAALFVAALGYIWVHARTLSSVDVILIGLLVWLIPLRQLYTHYVVWAMVPFLARGRALQSVLAGGLLELANTMAVWSWNIPPNPFPAMNTAYGFFVTSLVYFALNTTALVCAVKTHTRASQPIYEPSSGLERRFELSS